MIIHSPVATPLPPVHGFPRWAYAGKTYREVPLERILRDPYEDSAGFRQYEPMMRARPHRPQRDPELLEAS